MTTAASVPIAESQFAKELINSQCALPIPKSDGSIMRANVHAHRRALAGGGYSGTLARASEWGVLLGCTCRKPLPRKHQARPKK